MTKLDTVELHKAFLEALGDTVITHSKLNYKPLELDLKLPLPRYIRLYMYNLTDPPGGRTLGEHKIQLIAPGQERGKRASFDHSGERILLLSGYQASTGVFVLWDAELYPDFSYSRNLQVKAETVYAAIAGEIGMQERFIKGQGKEIVLTSNAKSLIDAINLRMQITYERLIGG